VEKFVDGFFSTPIFRFGGANMSKDDMPVLLQDDGKHNNTLRIQFFQGFGHQFCFAFMHVLILFSLFFLLIWVHPNFHSFGFM
jgi:hypothetical protein